MSFCLEKFCPSFACSLKLEVLLDSSWKRVSKEEWIANLAWELESDDMAVAKMLTTSNSKMRFFAATILSFALPLSFVSSSNSLGTTWFLGEK